LIAVGYAFPRCWFVTVTRPSGDLVVGCCCCLRYGYLRCVDFVPPRATLFAVGGLVAGYVARLDWLIATVALLRFALR